MTIEVYKKSEKLSKEIERLTKYVDCIEKALDKNEFKELTFSGYPNYTFFSIDGELNKEMHELFLSKFKPELDRLKKEFDEL